MLACSRLRLNSHSPLHSVLNGISTTHESDESKLDAAFDGIHGWFDTWNLLSSGGYVSPCVWTLLARLGRMERGDQGLFNDPNLGKYGAFLVGV